MSVKILGFRREMKPDGRYVDWVHLTNAAAMTENGQLTHSTWHRVAKLVPPESGDNEGKILHMRLMWEIVGPAYETWKRGDDAVDDGTPLSAWSGVDAARADVFRGFGLRTVEEVANMPETVLGRIPLPGVREMKRQAQLFLDAKDKDDLARRVAELESQLAASVEMLSEREEAAVEAAPKRGPGRPRKEAA